jgi:AP-2 complex subunit alpha
MQIGIKSDWRGSQGRMVLFVGNKHTAALMNVRSSILPPPHLRLKAAVVPESIPPRAQVGLYACAVFHC